MNLLAEDAPNSLSAFVEYMTPDEPPAAHHDFFCEILEAIERRDLMRVTMSCPPGHAKGVHVLFPIKTAGGWKTVGELCVGDRVYGTDGNLTTVVAKSEVFQKPCFKATTSDGEVVVVSDDHRWTLRKRRGYPFETMTTQEFYDWREKQKDKRAFLLPDVNPINYPEVDLIVDPYVLGAWLGDGTSTSGRFTVSDDDRAHLISQIENYYAVSDQKGITFQARKLSTDLRAIGVLKNKHIPDVYLNSSIEQRLALLQGLMDTDGNCRDNGGCRFVNTNERLIDQVRELLWSLGVPNSKTEVKVDQAYWKDGYKRSPCWCINFSGVDCFRLPRKKDKLKVHKARYGRYVTFEPCEIVPTQCIAVDAPDELFLVGRSFIPTHNTKFFSRYFAAWYLGRNPNHRYLQGGHSQNFAENEFGKYVRDIIFDPKFQTVFPGVAVNPKSSAAGNWRLHHSRGGYVTKGVGQSIAGYRGHIGGIDDPFGSRADAQSEAIRKTTKDWLFTDFRTRLLPLSPLFIVATRWHPQDLIGVVEELNKQGTKMPWTIYNLPALIETEEEMALDPMGRSMGEPLWGEYYKVEELLDLKTTLPAGDWLALYKGAPRDVDGNVVKSVWFKRYSVLPNQKSMFNEDGVFEQQVKRITVSVDCAHKATERANYSVAGVWVEDMQGNHYLAEVVRKRVEFPDLIKMIEDLATKWEANVILVEEAGPGIQYVQMRAGKAPAPVIGLPTNNKSKEFRFDGVTPMFEAGLVYLPRRAPWLADYEGEVLAFPNGSADDQADMTSQYLAWARKKGKYGSKRIKGTGHR